MQAMILGVLLAAISSDNPLTVRTRDGMTITGTAADLTLQLLTSFGSATINIASVQAIEFGDTDVVTTTDNHKLQGKLQQFEITLATEDGAKKLTRSGISAVYASRAPRRFEPGQTVHGTARNQLTYHVRVPASFTPDKPFPAIAILHGSNMNAQSYIDTIAAHWPNLADDYILIGINGERRVEKSAPDRPAYNYSGVNYMGKSKYKGYPGTDRESPGLIPEVILELRERLKLGKIFIGGHSQGGFVAYNVYLNFPDLFAGAFPISAGMWIQSEPTAFEDAELRAAQRIGAIAVVHGENDRIVPFSQAKDSFDSLVDDAFPAAQFFTDKSAGHLFARLPVEKAVRWLEQITSDNPESLLAFAEERAGSGEFRDASAALRRMEQLPRQPDADRIAAVERQINDAATPPAARLAAAIKQTQDDSWVDEFFQFRRQFQFAPAARTVMEAYQELRKQHQEPADRLWQDARTAFQKKDPAAGYAKYQEIVQRYYASSWYRYAKSALDNRKQ